MVIGFIGLGIMGGPMALNIIRKRPSDSVVVYTPNPERAAEIAAHGAEAAASAGEVGGRADVVISMVPTSNNVKSVYAELLPHAREGRIFIDMSSIDPEVSVALAKQVAEKGGVMLDCPVVKSKPAAVDGTLGIYAGGPADALEKVRDILLCMGSNLIHMGENGAGLVMKMCHNVLVAQVQNGVNEMLSMAVGYGISIDDFAAAISYGGGQNFYLDMKAAAIRDGNFDTAFSVRNMHKDLGIASRMIAEKGYNMPGASVAREVYEKAMAAGLADLDFSATWKIVSARQGKEQSLIPGI